MAPAPKAPTSSPAWSLLRSKSSTYAGTSGISAPKSMASRNTIALMTATRRRMSNSLCRRLDPNQEMRGAAVGPQKMHRAGLPLRPASRLTSAEAGADRETINLRCSVLGAHGNLGGAMHSVKCPSGEKCAICARSHSRWAFTPDARDSIRIVASSFAIELRTNKKCTGAVAPSSGFLTDLRRSGCRSGDHQPQVLLPRCNHHSRGWCQGGQGPVGSEFPQIANFASGAAANCALRMML